MLLGLTIRDVVLIDRLYLSFRQGLCVLTGETGAGKSILLDALGLALGRRAETGLVRPGAREAAVSAEFSVGQNHPAHGILREAGLDDGGEAIVMRRLVGADGRSRGFVNDEPASVGLLRDLGDSLVEIQGQFEQRGLLDPTNHRSILDAFADGTVSPHALAETWREWREAQRCEEEAARMLAASRDEEDLLRHHLAELDSVAPEEDEEDRLAARRSLLQSAERLAETLREAIAELDGKGGAQAALARTARRLERARERAQGLLDEALAATERAAAETAEALAALEASGHELELDPRALEKVEERLFGLRALARKHQVAIRRSAALARKNGIAAHRDRSRGRQCRASSRGYCQGSCSLCCSRRSGVARAGTRCRPARYCGGGRIRAIAARQGAVPHGADLARRERVGRARLRARAF